VPLAVGLCRCQEEKKRMYAWGRALGGIWFMVSYENPPTPCMYRVVNELYIAKFLAWMSVTLRNESNKLN
jgi:hypothetical protein